MSMSVENLNVAQLAALCRAAGVNAISYDVREQRWTLLQVRAGQDPIKSTCANRELESTLLDLIDQVVREERVSV